MSRVVGVCCVVCVECALVVCGLLQRMHVFTLVLKSIYATIYSVSFLYVYI